MDSPLFIVGMVLIYQLITSWLLGVPMWEGATSLIVSGAIARAVLGAAGLAGRRGRRRRR